MSLFHTPEFMALNGLHGIATDSGAGGSMLLLGPERGTYGGFQDAYGLDIMEELLKRAPQDCTIKLAPASHDIVLFSRSVNVLHRAGFLMHAADLNYDLCPRNINFTAGMSDGARKKLAKCERARFVSRKVERTEWKRAHAMLHKSRLDMGYAPPIPLAAITAVEDALPGSYLFFATYHEDAMVAAAITVRVREDISYVYCWGDIGKTEYAPVVHLFSVIYEDACNAGCRVLDAGTCLSHGVPSVGLQNFKMSLGFLPSVKCTMAGSTSGLE